jgi:hypothetical protein
MSRIETRASRFGAPDRLVGLEVGNVRLVRYACIVAIVAALTACGSSPAPTSGLSAPPAPSVDDGQLTFTSPDCRRDRFPCSRDEVSDDVRDRESAYVSDVLELIDEQSPEEAFAWVREQDGVVDGDAGELGLWFRLDGGQPVNITIAPTEPGGLTSAAPSAGRASLASSVMPASGRDDPPPAADIVGDGTSRDDGTNRKSALFLMPFARHNMGGFDQAIDDLRSHPDYYEPQNVVPIADSNVTPDQYATWRSYDAIFVATHGGMEGSLTWLGTGVIEEMDKTRPDRQAYYRELCDKLIFPYSGPDYTGVACGVVKDQKTPYVVVGVTSDFFRAAYCTDFGKSTERCPGLEKAIVYIAGCLTAVLTDLVLTLNGTTSAYLGWDNVIYPTSRNTTIALLHELTRGKPLLTAYETVFARGLGVQALSPARLILWPASEEAKNLRLLDLPTVRDPKSPTSILESGAQLRIQGTPGDGQNDALELSVEVIGVIDPEDTSGEPPPPPSEGPQPSDDGLVRRPDITLAMSTEDPASLYDLQVYVGDELVGSDNLGDPRPDAEVVQLDDTTYRYTRIFPLPFDVDPNGTATTLKVVVDLPEGGISDVELDVKLVGASYAIITVGNMSWEFQPSQYWQCFIGENASGEVAIVAGDYRDDGAEFGATLDPSGGSLSVSDDQLGVKWEALADREGTTVLHLLPLGSSQIDTITIEDGRAWGQATFIDTNAAVRTWQNNQDWPPSLPGTFDILCGG